MQSIKLILYFFKVVLFDTQFTIILASPKKSAGKNYRVVIFLFSWHSGFKPSQRVNYFSVPISIRLKKKKTHVLHKLLNFKMSDFFLDLLLNIDLTAVWFFVNLQLPTVWRSENCKLFHKKKTTLVQRLIHNYLKCKYLCGIPRQEIKARLGPEFCKKYCFSVSTLERRIASWNPLNPMPPCNNMWRYCVYTANFSLRIQWECLIQTMLSELYEIYQVVCLIMLKNYNKCTISL